MLVAFTSPPHTPWGLGHDRDRGLLWPWLSPATCKVPPEPQHHLAASFLPLLPVPWQRGQQEEANTTLQHAEEWGLVTQASLRVWAMGASNGEGEASKSRSGREGGVRRGRQGC